MNTKFKQLGTSSLTGSHPVADLRTVSGSRIKGEHRDRGQEGSLGEMEQGRLVGSRNLTERNCGIPSSATYSS